MRPYRSPTAVLGRRCTARQGALALLVASATMVACSPASSADSGTTVDTMNSSALATGPLADSAGSRTPMTTAAAMQALATRRVYFAHQSVGGNILAGVERLRAAHPAALRIVETRDPATVQGPAFVHVLAGRNTDPASKNADFLALLDARPARDGGIALLKYCYLDMRGDSDPAAVFAEYRRTVDAARVRHPDLTIVHVTMPLTTVEGTGKALVKRMMGKTTTREIALKRQQYNALLLREYAGREPVFDLAALESTGPGGARAAFRHGGETIFTLAPAYTDDGGHLNATGQQVIAERFVSLLATLAASQTASHP